MAQGVCPWWLGFLLACPLRRKLHDPERILGPFVRPGQTVLDVGCAMGFFTLPLARLAGPSGRVVAVDLQERMIRTLRKKADREDLAGRIETRVCPRDSLGIADLAGRVDFALAFAVVHEVPDPAAFFAQLQAALALTGRLLVAEPSGHVREAPFEATVETARAAGLAPLERPAIRRCRSVLLGRQP